MDFEIVGEIDDIETIAKGPSLRERVRLTAQFGRGCWRKLKGIATVRLRDGSTSRAELQSAWHWSPQVQDQALPGMSYEGNEETLCHLRSSREKRRYRGDIEVRKVYEVLPDDSAAWRRPAEYLRPEVRNGISSFATCADLTALKRLDQDLATGHWQQRVGVCRMACSRP